MAFVQSILSWLGLERPSARVARHPSRRIELSAALETVRSASAAAIENVLGATLYREDMNADGRSAFIEAGFGLVNSERLRVVLDQLDAKCTQVRIEAIYPANLTPPEQSLAVETLADTLLAHVWL